jgi:hypothetical protein
MLLLSPPPGSTITAYMGNMPGTVIYYLMYDTNDQSKITDWARTMHEEMILRQAAPPIPPVATPVVEVIDDPDKCASCGASIADCMTKKLGTCFNRT